MKLTGSLFPNATVLSDLGVVFTPTQNGNYFAITTESAINFFDKIAVQDRRFDTNELGLFQSLSIGSDRKARIGSLSTPKHLLRARKNGCVWSPKGKILTEVTEFPVFPIVYQGEECPDAFWNSCFERIFGTGNAVNDLMSSPEGAALVQNMLRRVYIGLGNSASDLVWYGNHPDIDTVNTSGFYKVSVAEWSEYYEQQTDTDLGGAMTLLDQLRSQGVEQYSVQIPDTDIDETTGEYIGDIEKLFQTMIKAAHPDFQAWIKYGYMGANGVKYFPIMMLTQQLFNAYEQYLRQTFVNQPDMFEYTLRGENNAMTLLPGVLKYKNMPVVSWDEVGKFDQYTGAVSYKAGIFAPGFFGIAHDVTALQQFEGMGLVMNQRLDLPYQGQIFMQTNFNLGAGISDVNFGVYASNVKLPTS